jgi:peptidoglycan hydrolase-like protein with peptidoglycan-binding domain
MKTMILATVAAAALCMPALAQQSSTQPQTEKQQTQAPASKSQSQAQGQSQSQNQSASASRVNASHMSRNQVREIQQALDRMGFKAGQADGKWGPETKAALSDFQKSKNMSAIGDVDSMTIAALGLNPSDFGMGSAGTTGQAPNNGGRNNAPSQNGSSGQHNQH